MHTGYKDFLHEERGTVLKQSDIGREIQRSVCDEAGGATRAKVKYLAGYVLSRNSRNRVDANLYRKDHQKYKQYKRNLRNWRFNSRQYHHNTLLKWKQRTLTVGH